MVIATPTQWWVGTPKKTTTPSKWWEQPTSTTAPTKPTTTTQPTKDVTPFKPYAPEFLIPRMTPPIEAAQKAEALSGRAINAVSITDEAGQPMTFDLSPTDFGLGEEVERAVLPQTMTFYDREALERYFSREGREMPLEENLRTIIRPDGREAIEWIAPRMDIGVSPLTFSVDYNTGDMFAMSDDRVVGELDKETGEFALLDSFVNEVRSQYMRAYAPTVPVRTWFTGIPIQPKGPIAEWLYSRKVIGGKMMPAPAEVLGVIGLIGTLGTMGYQGITALQQVGWSGVRKELLAPFKSILDTYIKHNTKDIALLAQRDLATLTGKQRILHNIYNLHNQYMARQAREIHAVQFQARRGGVPTVNVDNQIRQLTSATQTANNVAEAVKKGKELTTTSIKGLVATGTPTEFTSGVTAIISGQVIPIAGVEFNPITTPVGKGYEILQYGNRVGEVSYNPNVPGVKGIVIDRIDIIPEAQRQGLATQAIDKVLTEAEQARVPLYTGIMEPDGVQLFNALEQRGLINLSPAPQRMLGELVTRGVSEYAPTTAMAEEAITGEVPLGRVEITGIPTSEKQLRQSIMATVKTKGLSESKYRALFKQVGGTRNLTEMGADKLNKVLEAVRETRPVRIKGKNVITAKTERAIQTLKDILIAEKKLTPEIYENLKKYSGLPTDKYEGRELFITERQARNLIRQMNVEAEAGITGWDVRVAGGLVNKPELKTSIDTLTSRIVTENKPKPKRDITIPFRKVASEISEYSNDVGLSGTMSILRALRRFQEQLGGREATRIYEVAEMMVELRRLNEITLANTINAMKMEVPQLATIIKDKDAMDRIQQWLDSDLKIVDIKKPDLAPTELEVAQLFRSRYDQWKNAVRLERFKDAYYHYGGRAKEAVAELIKHGTEDTSDVAIPDAPLKDIKEAIGIFETQGETALREYLNTKDWGVLKSGYSFSQILHPKLRMYRGTSVKATTTSLHQRKGLDFLRDERTAWERLVAYERQMIGLNLQSYYRKMDTEFRRAQEGGRISPESANSAANKISLFMREVKGYPIENPAVAFLLRIGGWSFGTLAKLPWMSVRNLHQNIAFGIDKIEMLKALATRGFFGNPLTKRGRLDYTDAFVHQYKGVQQEQMLMGYMGKTPLENLIRKTDYYHLSDKLNRYLCMAGQGAKAERALNQYLKDGDVSKFLKNSGANELSATEQIRILEYLALDTYDYGGVLESVSGGEAAVRDIANKITTLTHFNYVRYLRSSVEMGETGRIIGSLVAFPRSVVERYVDIFSRLKRLTGADRKRAVHSLTAMVVGSLIASALLKQLTGRDRDAYNPLLIMQWQVGGLAMGATQEIMELYRLLTNLTFAESESQRKYYGDEIVLLIPRLGDMFIPFYVVTMNLLESLGNARYIDRKWLRQIRETFDENYELNEEYYKIERDMLERIQHGLFGTKTPDPSDLETALKKLEGTREMLGEIDTEEFENSRQKAEEAGRLAEWSAKYTEEDFLYTTNNLGTDIGRAINNLDPSEITIGNGFSELVLEYMEYQTLYEEYKWSPSDKRFEYREENPETDAQLFFWSYVTTLQSDTAKQIVTQMITRYGIPTSGIRGYDSEFGEGGQWWTGGTGPSTQTTPTEWWAG